MNDMNKTVTISSVRLYANDTTQYMANRSPGQYTLWGRGGVVVSELDFRSEGRWFDAQSLPSRCFLGQDTFSQIVSLHPGV